MKRLSQGLCTIVLMLSGTSLFAQNSYFGGSGALSGANWSSTSGGPFTSNFTTNTIATFEVAGAAVTGGAITVSGINASANIAITSASGTISNTGNGVVPITVSSGVTMDFGGQSFTSSATAGYQMNGPGILAMAGNTYGGGFTLNNGIIIVRGVNAMGGGATNTLTINTGAIVPNSTRDLSGKFAGGITIGGNFTIGTTGTTVGTVTTSPTANLTFSNNTSLGGANRTITIGGNGTYTMGGVISNTAGGLTVAAATGATGNLTLTGINTYSGGTTINGGTLNANTTTSGTNSATGTGAITVNNTGTLAGTGSALGNVAVASGGRVIGGVGAVNQTLSVTSVTIDSGSFLRAQVTGTGGNANNGLAGASRLALSGNLDVTTNYLTGGGPMNIELSGDGSTFVAGQTYSRTIMSFGGLGTNLQLALGNGVPVTTGTIVATDGAINLLPLGFAIQSDWSVQINPATNPNSVVVNFTPVPEPSTALGFAAFGVAALRLVRRRK